MTNQKIIFTFFLIAFSALADADYPAWRLVNFTGPDLSDEAISGPQADPDSDNLPNLYEYASGTNPYEPNSMDTTLSPRAEWVKGDYAELAINLPGNAMATEATYAALASSDLGKSNQWQAVDGTRSATVINADGSTRRQILLPQQALDLRNTVRTFLQPTIAMNRPAYLWIEAEDNTSVSSHWIESNNVLSAGRWVRLNEVSNRHIEWNNINISEGGEYSLYIRKFWKHGPFHWSIDGSSDPSLSGQITSDVSLLDSAELYTHNVANWIFVQTVNLSSGNHSLRIEQDSATGAAAYDCILLIRGDFQARGSLKPEEHYAAVPEAGWFDFQPDPDTFNPTPIDLRYLNDSYAGSRGWITTSGSQFVYPDNGEPLRLWGINMGPGQYALPHDRMDTLARFYAKRGINHVRLHGAIYNGSGIDFEVIKPELLDGIHYLVKALKEQGIYTTLSIYFPLWVNIHPDDTRFPGYNNSRPFSLLYFNQDFEAIYQDWWDAVMTTPNPYTGIALKDEPALLSCELINEDSTLFWTFSLANIPDPQMRMLEKQFGAWCADSYRYGSIVTTLATWNEPNQRDNVAEGRLGFVGLWNMANGADTQRDKDTVRFLTELMRSFYDRNLDYLKNTLGYKGMVQGTNWKTASAEVLDPLEKWANAGMDYLDNHGYYGPAHYGDANSYAVRINTAYQDRSALRFDDAINRSLKDFSNPVMATNYAGKPTMISEINWPEPNAWRADTIPFIAAYGALQGIDAVALFTTTAVAWDTDADVKFPMQTPVTMAQWPGAALMFRKGLVQTGSPAVAIDLSMQDLWNLQGTPLPQPQNLDSLRDPGIGSGESSAGSLSFLVGPVEANFIEGPAPSAMTDNASGFVDTVNQTVTSITGEISLDYGTGLLSINAPQAQGISGFLGESGTQELADVSISSNMPYGSIHLIAMDDLPISTSNSILLQVVSEERLNGFTTRPVEAGDTAIDDKVADMSNGVVITDVGKAPMMVRELDGTIQLKRQDASALSVFACDINGNLIERVGSADNIILRPDVFYYFIHDPK